MKTSLFHYDLPPDLIAQFPLRRRSESRLLVLDRDSGNVSHRRFADILTYCKGGDAFVVNNTKVFKARLIGRRQTGAKVEIFLVRPVAPEVESGVGSRVELWEALAQPSRRLAENEAILFDEKNKLTLREYHGDGRWVVEFSSHTARERIVSRFGHVPLPQYVNREDQTPDIRRYQTVYAGKDKIGAVAAPTAGFHFTRGLLRQLHDRSVNVIEVTLHVGPGTFKPISVEEIEDHTVDMEMAELSTEAAETLNRVREHGGSIFAVGTTSVRTIESAATKNGAIVPFSGMVDLYIQPGHRFRFVDHLITNFHLPESSLLVLVSAFAGREAVLAAYQQAITERYRFYSYGDSMLIL